MLRVRSIDPAQAVATIIERTSVDAFGGSRSALEVEIDDLEAGLDEVNTIIESQIQLQDASQGVLFMHWNDALQTPLPAVPQ